MPADPPPPAPFRVDLTDVQPGTFPEGSGGGLLNVSGAVIARIEGTSSGLFSVVDLEGFRLVKEPDAPGRDWESVGSVDGAGPITVGPKEFLSATVVFACPSDPAQDAFDAVVHLVRQDDQTQSVLSIPVHAALPVEGVGISDADPIPTSFYEFFAGEKKTINYNVSSSFRKQSVDGTVAFHQSSDPAFTASPAPFHVGPLGRMRVGLDVTCASGTAVGLHQLTLTVTSLSGNFQSFAFEREANVLVAQPSPGPGVDESIQWSHAGTSALAIDKDRDIWRSGHVNAIIPLGGDSILVGSDTGGVWSVTSAGDALALSDDWDIPDMTCMAIGPDGPNHFYAGAGSIINGAGTVYVSEPDTVFLNFIKWHNVPLVDSAGNSLNTGRVLCMVVTKGNRKLVLGCDNGVFWSDIPPLGGQHVFLQVPFLPQLAYSGAALAPNDTIVVATIGDGTALSGIFFGSWSPGGLLFNRATITGAFDSLQMRRTSLASCDGQPQFMYAVTAKPDSSMLAVLKSSDGGQSWSPLQTTARGSKGQNRPLETVDVTGFQGQYNNCIAVSPFDPATLLIGWRNGPWISQDGGAIWDAPHLNDDDPHLHEDLHCLIFDPSDTSGRTFYVGNDGGIAVTRDLGASYTNEHNRHLHTLQFEGNWREFWGVFTPSRLVPGLFGGGLQDNGDVYAAIDSPFDEYLQLEGGDGHVMVFIDTGHGLHCNGDNVTKITANRFDGAHLVDGFTVPVGDRGPGGTDVSDGLPLGIVEPVAVPTFRSGGGQLMYAMACVFGSGDVYGLFANNDGGNMHWDYVGTVPISAQNGAVWALASLHGDNVFAGTQDGRIFSLSPRSKQPFELAVPLRDTKPGEVGRICVLRDGVAFASYRAQGKDGFLLQSNFFSWDPLGSNNNVAKGIDFPTTEGPIYGFDIDRGASPPTLFAATDTNVYVSRDEGDTWKLATKGLPRCSHCTELRAVSHDNGQRFLYLSTFGRSVWRARLAG